MSVLNLSIPKIDEDDLSNKKNVKRIMNYLALLDEQLRYALQNLSFEDNMDESTTRWKLSTDTKSAELSLSIDGLTVKVSDNEKGIAVLQVTAEGLTSSVQDIEGNVSILQQTANSLTSSVQDIEGNVSILQQTAEGLQTAVKDNENNISLVSQTANKINWLVASGTSASNFSLTDRVAELIAQQINITGYVTFNDLERSGSTTINGDNITTGEIDCELITSDGDYLFYRSSSGLQIGYGLPSGDSILLGGDRVLVCQRNSELAFFGSSGNERQVVARATRGDTADDLVPKINILIDALESYGLIESE